MKCEYCEIKVKRDDIVREHFIPQSLGGRTYMEDTKKKRNIYQACNRCDNAKRGAAFWSINAFREFLKIKSTQPKLNFTKFIREKFKRAIQHSEKRYLLSLALDDISLKDFKLRTNTKYTNEK